MQICYTDWEKNEEAIKQEERALYYAENYEKGRMINDFKDALEKMKKGEKMWPVKIEPRK